MNYYKIELDGNHFAERYLVYLIEVCNDEFGKFFYVGQTGNRNHFTARPAFRRLGAHLSDQGRSTENQLYRSIATEILQLKLDKNSVFTTEVKFSVSKFLRNSKICMHAFPIRDFKGDFEEDHKKNRKFVEDVECALILQILNKHERKFLLNKRLPNIKSKISKEALDIAIEIVEKTFS